MIRVLVVDDSATMRALVSAALRRDPGIAVAGEAGSAAEAREAMKALDPDVVTLDVEMPQMSGLDFLERIMRLRPTPVVMVSSLTSRGAETTLSALELGAFDCVAKPSISGPHTFDALPAVVRAAAAARVRGLSRTCAAPASRAPDRGRHAGYAPADRLVAIGASTGGVEALLTVLSGLPADCPPVLVTQHMPAAFTPGFAARLDRCCAAEVAEARDGAPLAPGRVWLAPGGAAHLQASPDGRRCRLTEGGPVNGHRPSVDVLFASVARAAGPRGVGVILTGMGRDGADGLLAMRRAGARTLGQDEASCVVYGMPRAALEAGGVERQLPLGAIAARLVDLTDARLAEACHGRALSMEPH